MANKTANEESTQNVAASTIAVETKANQQKLQRMLATRMQAVTKFGKMTPKMQRGFDRFAANIAATKE